MVGGWGVTFRGYLAKISSFKSGNLLYKSNFYLLSEGTVHKLRERADKDTLPDEGITDDL